MSSSLTKRPAPVTPLAPVAPAGPVAPLGFEVATFRRDGTYSDARRPDSVEFTDAEGAGMHCEMMNRSMANRRILDWLDDTLGAVRST